MKIALCGLVLASLLSPLERTAAASAELTAEARSRIDAVIEQAITEKRLVGTVVLISHAVLIDPAPTHTPQSPGTWNWGGVYGHSWFVDPTRKLTVVALTNTGLEGIWGKFTTDLRDAVYQSVK